MATLTVQTVNRSGITPSLTAASSGGDEFANDGGVWLEIWNDHATDSRTVTIAVQRTVDGQAVTSRTVTVTAANDRGSAGPWPVGDYNDANSKVQITYSDSGADIRVGVFDLTST